MARIANIDLGEFPLLLAPMEDVSDPPFRALCKQHGADLMYTEFISSEGLIRDAAKSVAKLDIFEYERPIGIQIFGAEIDSMREAAAICEEANPDIIDINYGCPVKKVACKGAGAGILQDIPKMVSMTAEIVKAVQKPVTVKTRLGWDDNTKYIVDVAERLQDVGIQAISIHGRTRKQMYKGEADWSLIAAVKNNPRMHIPVFGNGDVDSPEKALEMRNLYGVDGVMIGRASIGYPWIFNEIKHFMATGMHLAAPTLEDRVAAARRHLELAIQWKGEGLAIAETRRHYGNYFRDFPHFKDYRMTLVTSNEVDELMGTFEAILTEYGPAMAEMQG
ncbi:MAG TPA: tRNA dihydrouridine synthase DusB [Cryomorphaceae bacterium]|jgi:tRNA-dihydrouridine synthase B|nr:MAG: nitrogen fixation protein NifR [Cryomorphaceae bacterium BACL7 MAG-120910-bin2]KRO69346.1 MAG: nitrogen fixation protein NifR [Cryomorphaceae bacterium BACL7 MAG-120322-bin74]KRO83348.1 MAG: nitrogen fixation protein NifR [Cryomorphaceae bacterium BACL7 MAG-121220-bin83]NQW25321.1 tRNA dihydrouridine synthase DusB [Cryomorphaceae bacterium]HAB31781.1 tRNA dihydrouridine synthase DusB [Cryomorphaceae bacterium]